MRMPPPPQKGLLLQLLTRTNLLAVQPLLANSWSKRANEDEEAKDDAVVSLITQSQGVYPLLSQGGGVTCWIATDEKKLSFEKATKSATSLSSSFARS